MTWSTTDDVHAFLAAAGGFLTADPVANTVLLTEAAYLAARPADDPDQCYGWWQPDGGAVAGAFLRAPRHPPILSAMPDDALVALAEFDPKLPPLGVDAQLADTAVEAWRAMGVELAERSRVRLYRLDRLRAPMPPPGRPRVADEGDRDLLGSWYEALMAAHPDDPSDRAYVVDDPLAQGGITLWEVDGAPVAMAGRSRVVAGMTRLSAVYAAEDPRHGDAAFVAACAAAQRVATDVLVFADATDHAADGAYLRWGFVPVLDRVTIG